MKGHCKHIVESASAFSSEKFGVRLYNDEDTLWDQIFETKEELNAFIEELVDMGKEVFGD